MERAGGAGATLVGWASARSTAQTRPNTRAQGAAGISSFSQWFMALPDGEESHRAAGRALDLRGADEDGRSGSRHVSKVGDDFDRPFAGPEPRLVGAEAGVATRIDRQR